MFLTNENMYFVKPHPLHKRGPGLCMLSLKSSKQTQKAFSVVYQLGFSARKAHNPTGLIKGRNSRCHKAQKFFFDRCRGQAKVRRRRRGAVAKRVTNHVHVA